MNTKNYTADMVSRNVKPLGNGVIEITRYNVSYFKAILVWPWFIIVTAITLNDIITQTGMYNDIQWAISVDWALENGWNLYKDVKESFGENVTTESYIAYKAKMLELHPDAIYYGWFYILFPIFWFVLLCLPNGRPVRIDAKRRLIYFWWWGRFYIKQYPENLKDNEQRLIYFLQTDFHSSWLNREAMSSLIMDIPFENPERNKKASPALGAYRPVCEYQSYYLRDFIVDYLKSPNPDEEFAHYFKKEKRIWLDYFRWFYRFHLFPNLGYNEKKTEAKIQAWLKKYGDGQ
ncbi:hypothetical protein D3M79_08240 [Rodentibacter pneumotropicus]|uniref:Uncharacterized protein n=1 Tax=Rodentibacter pneumotropicus TaxID=758 RepID=A0A4S2P757_9PAST|nr:hypothetical protein [Rodentibacter pneumotropicus]TGZ98819.1 hypothetical protein D3M79_08240 [Rodentibacter pneumotropicus]TGZ99653.1 hypothetical protein D3M74_09360 [Rodentibacter pneumotropicus]THA05641.1 hypothetical protein D3M77_09235 [Rodentibacter pneumotropicus]THA13564.1 hypothetical protein D3M76_08700 [Rodentibacter pneumotropicus]